jgi:hypothetical protein
MRQQRAAHGHGRAARSAYRSMRDASMVLSYTPCIAIASDRLKRQGVFVASATQEAHRTASMGASVNKC